MVRAGEASGSLDLVLKRLAEFSEHQEALKGRIRAAMIYPIIMTIKIVRICILLPRYPAASELHIAIGGPIAKIKLAVTSESNLTSTI